MNTQIVKSYPETKAAVLNKEESRMTSAPLSDSREQRLARIKSAMNRTARERRRSANR